MGDETHQTLTLRGLRERRRLLQAKIAREIEIRYTPKLTFLLDQGVKHSIEVARILQQVLPPEKTDEDDSSPEPAERIETRMKPSP